jgi:hypothetical protein
VPTDALASRRRILSNSVPFFINQSAVVDRISTPMPLACVKDLQIHCPAENALSDLQISSVLPALKTRLSNSFMDGGLANTYNTEDLLALLVYGLFVVNFCHPSPQRNTLLKADSLCRFRRDPSSLPGRRGLGFALPSPETSWLMLVTNTVAEDLHLLHPVRSPIVPSVVGNGSGGH